MSPGDLRASLTISAEEAQQGVSRTITLPGGRKAIVVIPPGVSDGQMLRTQGAGEPSGDGGPNGDLLLTIHIGPTITSPLPTLTEEPTVGASFMAPVSQAADISEEATLRDIKERINLAPPAVASSSAETLAGNRPPLTPQRRSAITQPIPSIHNDPANFIMPNANVINQPPASMTSLPILTPTPLPVESEQVQWYPVGPSPLPPPPPSGNFVSLPPAAFPRPQPQNPFIQQLRIFPLWREMLLILVALLVVTASGALFSVIRTNQLVDAGVKATETAHVQVVSTNHAASVTAQTSATAAASLNPYPPHSGTLVFADGLLTNSHNWDDITNCSFTIDGYHASSLAQGVTACFAKPDFGNFVYEAEMRIVQGDTGGIVFRYDKAKNTYYYFSINLKGQYKLQFYGSGGFIDIAGGSASSSIKTGTSDTNVLAVVAKGRNVDLYANQQRLLTVSDTLYIRGQIGVASGTNNTTNTADVSFVNAKLWNI